MTGRSRWRPAVFAGGLAVAAVVLSGCQKPSPAVTVQSGARSVHRQAQCWAYSEQGAISSATCTPSSGSAGQIIVSAGATIGISVDPTVAQNGWYPLIDGTLLVRSPLRTTYYKTALDNTQLTSDRLLTVTALAADGRSVRGVWNFVLTPAS